MSIKKIGKTFGIIVLMIILLLFLFLFFSGKSFSKYKNDITSRSMLSLKKPIFVVNGADDIKIDGIQDATYKYSVSNYKDNEVSEADLDYYINIENNSKADLEFELTKDNEKIELNNNQSNLISLSSFNKQEDEYLLKVKYNNNPAIEENIAGNIQIKVEAVQAQT